MLAKEAGRNMPDSGNKQASLSPPGEGTRSRQEGASRPFSNGMAAGVGCLPLPVHVPGRMFPFGYYLTERQYLLSVELGRQRMPLWALEPNETMLEKYISEAKKRADMQLSGEDKVGRYKGQF